jgi:DNA-binding NarL/FixJ family response regulator
MAIRLFILVKERVFADALAIRLDTEPDMDVVAALHTSAPPRHLCTGMVDVLLLDGDLPDDAAYRLCEKMSHGRGAPHVVVLSHSADSVRIVRTIRAGAVGWVGKDESLDRLICVIRGVARNETWLPAGQTGQMLRLLLREPERESAAGTQTLDDQLSGRRAVG